MNFASRFNSARDRWLPGLLHELESVLAQAPPPGSSLAQMCSYHLQTGGKRLRALLPLLTAQALDRDPSFLLPFGAACEMLHNATLVHDDLQDGDTVRRGQATIWTRYGMPQAVNLGDAMFYFTILLAQRVQVEPALREACTRRILMETLRVIDGQEREFALKTARQPSLQDYFVMVEGKTSGLFSLPMAGAAQLCGAEARLVDALADAARHMGVLFQVQDDVLDLYGDKGRQQRGSDVGEGKRSALVLHCLANAHPGARARLLAILDSPREDTSPEDVAWVAKLFQGTGSLAFALEEIHRRASLAVQVPALSGHQPLRQLVEGMCQLFMEPIHQVMGTR